MNSSAAPRGVHSRVLLVWGLVFLAGLLITWPIVVLQTIRAGSHNKSIVVSVDGLDSSVLRLVSIGTRSPIGSQGQLQPCDEPGVFATAFASQPISELFLHLPANVPKQAIQVSAYFGMRLPPGKNWRDRHSGQTVTIVSDELGEVSAGHIIPLRFQPLSGYSRSPWGRALNWSGDVALVLRTLARATGLSLGLLLLINGGWAFVTEFRRVQHGASGVVLDGPVSLHPADSARSLLMWCGLMAVIAGILFFRDPRVLLSPSMEVEDGTMIFQHFYHHREMSELLRFKAGYVPLIPNLLGYLSVRVPTTWAAHWLAAVPFLLSVFLYSLLFCRPYARLFPGRGSAAAACLLLAFAPVSDRLLLANTDYMIWNLLGMLLLLSVVDPGRGLLSSSVCLLGLPLLICSHPLSILAGPVLVFRWFLERRLRSYWLISLGVVILYQLLGVQHDQVPQGDSITGKLLQVRDVSLLAFQFSGQLAVRSLLGRVWTESLSPETLQTLSWGMVLVFSGVLFRVLMRRTQLWKETLLGLYFVYGLTFLCLYARGAESIVNFDGAPRYIYIQSLVFLTLCASTLSSVVESCRVVFSMKMVGGRQLLPAAVWTLILGWNWHLNWELGCFGGEIGKHTPYLVQQPENGATVSSFLQQLAQLEKKTESGAGFRVEAVKRDDWTITIDTRVVKKDGGE